MEKKITKIEALSKLPKKTRVAAYARVSSGKDAMLHSLVSQVNQYKKLIKENNEWQFAGVYADSALTGTKDERKEFQRLIKDCRAGKIDMIITKSISRFARNTVTLLETVRELDSSNIDVFFEEQNIHSISGEGEMILTFLATFAQEESRSVSENMKWRIKKDFQQGIIWGGKSCLGYNLVNKKLKIVPKEAEIVKLIYNLYINGKGDEQICKILEAKKIKPSNGKRWYWSTIKHILENYNYTGNLILQKTYRENHLTKKKRVNNGQFDKYLIKDDHEAIVTVDTFNKVQKIRKARLEQIKVGPARKYAFSGMLTCGVCGRRYTHKNTAYNEIWKCSYAEKRGKDACHSKQVTNDTLIEASNYILKMEKFDKEYFQSRVESMMVMPKNRLVFILKDGSTKEYIWKAKSRKDSWTPEMKEQARIKELNRLKGVIDNG